MFSRPAHIHLGAGLSPREGAIDALYRYVEGLDRADENLLRSAFTSEAVLDLSGLTPTTGVTYEEMKGIDTIVNSVLSHVGPMDSQHQMSNFRVKLSQSQNEAEVTCYVLGELPKTDNDRDLDLSYLLVIC